jgi:hypothetical protein
LGGVDGAAGMPAVEGASESGPVAARTANVRLRQAPATAAASSQRRADSSRDADI